MTIMLSSFIFIYCCTLLGVSLFTYMVFWYEACNSDHRHYLRQISKDRVGRWLARAIVGNFLSQNLVVLFFPLCLWRRLWDPEPDSTCTHPPVLLVHGLFHNASAWVIFRWVLRRRGFRNTYAISYNCLNTNFAALLQRLDREVQRLADLFPGQQIVLVGHSLGGLLAKAYVEDSRHHDKISALVTLGTPHQGSKLAALGVNRLARSLIFKGELVRELQSRAEPSPAPKLSIYSPIDNLVLPNDSLRAAGSGWSSLESSPVSHIAMLHQRRLAVLVAEYLLVRARRK